MRELLLYASLPVAVLFILRNPFLGLMCYIGANIIRPEMLFWGGRQGTIVFMTFAGATVVSLFLSRKGSFREVLTTEMLLFIWVWLAVLVSLLFSDYPLNARAYTYANDLLKLCVLGWLMLSILDSEKRARLCVEGMVLFFSLLAVWGIDQSFRGNERLEGLMGSAFDSNGTASVFVLAVPMALGVAFHSPSKRSRMIGWGAALALIIAIVATKSRGGFLGLCFCIFIFFLRSKRKKTILLGLSLLIIPATYFVTDDYLSRLETMTVEEEERDFSAASRLVLWKAGMLVFKDNPLFGTGFLSYPVAKLEYRDAVPDVDEALREYTFQGFKVGHNTYVQLLAEGGLFLFIPYMWLLCYSLWANHKARGAEKDKGSLILQYLNCVEAGLLGMCLCNVFLDAVTSFFIPTQIFLARALRTQLGNGATATVEEKTALAPALRGGDENTVPGV